MVAVQFVGCVEQWSVADLLLYRDKRGQGLLGFCKECGVVLKAAMKQPVLNVADTDAPFLEFLAEKDILVIL